MRPRLLVLSFVLFFAVSLSSSASAQPQWGFSLRKPLYLLKITHGAEKYQTNSEADGTEKLRQEWDVWMQKGRVSSEAHLYGRSCHFFSGAFMIAQLLDDSDLEQKTIETTENLYQSVSEKEKHNPISVVPRDLMIGFVIACVIIILFILQGIEWLPWRLVVAVVLLGGIGLIVYSQVDKQDQIKHLGEAVTNFKKSVDERQRNGASLYKIGSWGYQID